MRPAFKDGLQTDKGSRMNQNLTSLIHVELNTAKSYLGRLFSALIDLSYEGGKKTVKILCAEASFKARKILLQRQQQVLAPIETPTGRESLEIFMQGFQYLEALLHIDHDRSNELCELSCEYLNHVFTFCFQLHLHLDQFTSFEIALPREVLIDIQGGDEKIPHYFLNSEKLLQISKTQKEQVWCLHSQRQKKYQSFFFEGQKALSEGQQEAALKFFEKAKNFQETAEVMTFMARCHVLDQNQSEVYPLLIKALRIDPQYGPAYNEMGVHLLKEKKNAEALAWFQKAKRATQFTNRESAYINTGRAYMAMNQFEEALEEFRNAYALYPQNDKLLGTIEHLKQLLERSQGVNFPETSDQRLF